MANVVSTHVCATCATPLGPAEDVCAVCLLRAGLESSGTIAQEDAAFGDFEIARRDDGSLCELGRGAMGVTYRARDTVLHRDVALKVIEPPASRDAAAVRERFLREARAAAALRHRNVAEVFQFGSTPEGERCYCAMELVEGETLEARVRRDGPIDVALALEIATQVARALGAAAERGLVHRDLKPGNIMLARGRESGAIEVKVIDFGLAKAVTPGTGEMELTQDGFVGTPAFASPEQFAGGTVDARSDIYALGVTVWFALTGRLPFGGTTIEEVRKRQAEQAPPLEQLRARGVPMRVIEILRSCLALDPAERPSPGELLDRLAAGEARVTRRRKVLFAGAAVFLGLLLFALWQNVNGPASNPGATEKGVAILPFENLSAQGGDAFLAEGIQDDVLTSVGKIKDLKVISRSSVADYRGAKGPGKVREIGQSLGVSHVLEGSVRRAGEKLILNVALIDTRDERQIWSERYERRLDDSLSLQGELALEIARALHSSLSPQENTVATTKPTENAEAYLLYLKARQLDVTDGDYTQALALYDRAIALDPKFALARAHYAMAAGASGFETQEQSVRERARAEAEKALHLQPNLGEARLALATWYLLGARDLNRALEEVRRAGELLPNSAEVQLISAFIHKREGKYGERLAALRRAEVLDPRNQRVQSFLVLTLRWVREWREAMQASERRAVVSKGPAFLTCPWSRARDEFRLTGDINVLKRALAEEEQTDAPAERLNYARFEIASFERDFARAAQFLHQVPAEAFGQKRDDDTVLSGFSEHGKEFHQALLTVAQSSTDAAVKEIAFAQAREILGAGMRAMPEGLDATRFLADLALLNAFAGRKEEAIRTAQRAVEMRTGVRNWLEQNDILAALALVYAQTGEPEKALDLIEHLLTVPVELQDDAIYNMTLVDLKWRWVWDPLRNHPRFQKLLAGPEPRTIY